MSVPEAYYLNAAGWSHLAVYGVMLPLVVVRNARRIAARILPLPDRIVHFRSTAFTLVSLAVGSFAAARAERIELFPREAPKPWGILAGLMMLVATIGIMRPLWRRAVEQKARVVHLFMADTWHERGWWLAVSFAAGIGEEITWRGVQTALLAPLVGSYWIAGLLSAISFALAHWVQGWRSAAGIFLFALGFQAIVLISGSLYVAMAVHVLYDVACGLAYGRYGRALGYKPDLGGAPP
jgi:membrane protease YdiL (CAAX protease family)